MAQSVAVQIRGKLAVGFNEKVIRWESDMGERETPARSSHFSIKLGDKKKPLARTAFVNNLQGVTYKNLPI